MATPSGELGILVDKRIVEARGRVGMRQARRGRLGDVLGDGMSFALMWFSAVTWTFAVPLVCCMVMGLTLSRRCLSKGATAAILGVVLYAHCVVAVGGLVV